ncbi:hypothetical protein [Lederbergia lenta]|uniref:hypothetical protein n=1 Tax=Lederbergia lenta TaxID=1467 RepID=UPI0020407B42|nr:hypothetical protein [Lederbergia lenta]MCM3113626.1 hypothetical protein [Lederbergia lenta]
MVAQTVNIAFEELHNNGVTVVEDGWKVLFLKVKLAFSKIDYKYTYLTGTNLHHFKLIRGNNSNRKAQFF